MRDRRHPIPLRSKSRKPDMTARSYIASTTTTMPHINMYATITPKWELNSPYARMTLAASSPPSLFMLARPTPCIATPGVSGGAKRRPLQLVRPHPEASSRPPDP